jgi:hypothetical protein
MEVVYFCYLGRSWVLERIESRQAVRNGVRRVRES